MKGTIDSFVRNNLPRRELLPVITDVPGHIYPRVLNATTALVDRWVQCGAGDRPALRSPTAVLSYAELQATINRYAEVLMHDLGVVQGNRVLLRGRNSPALAALHLAVMRVGGVVVSTMPMLRAGELRAIVAKAEVTHAICEADLTDELVKCQVMCPTLRCMSTYAGSGAVEGSLHPDMDNLAADKQGKKAACRTLASDPCLIAFTSGTTGVPKGAVHTHRDILAICDTFSAHIVRPTHEDIFCGTPPLAFTYGLGGLLLFPLRVGASTILLESAKPTDLLAAVAAHRATVCFTAPTAYRAMLEVLDQHDIGSLRICVSAGETLPQATFDAFRRRTGIRLVDGIGATEMLHIFISASGDDIRPGATGKVVPGYVATILDDEGNELPPGVTGWLAVRGPTGCRYLNDQRQRQYVRNGWNLTGDAYYRDADGYFWYQSRMDDMIISSGYNISAPEVEGALLSHSAVAECAVVGKPDKDRGAIVKAFVVLGSDLLATPALVTALQSHVKAAIAPFKYPREIEFVDALPKTLTGKLKRFELRLREAA